MNLIIDFVVRRMTHLFRFSCVVTVLLTLFSVFFSPRLALGVAPELTHFLTGIQDSRCEGDYAGARSLAADLYASLETVDDPLLSSVDLALLIKELDAYTSLSPVLQTEAAGAECMDDSLRARYFNQNSALLIELARRQLAVRSRVLPRGHGDVLRSRIWLARGQRQSGDLETAAISFQECLEQARRAWGDDHLERQQLLMEYAGLMKDHAGFAAAESLYADALAMLTRMEEPPPAQSLYTIDNITQFYDDRVSLLLNGGLFEEATAVASRMRTLLASVSRLARPFHLADAERQVTACTRMKALPDSARADLSAAYAMGADLDLNQPANAVELTNQRLKIFEELLGADSPEYSECLKDLGTAYWYLQDAAKADSLYREALSASERAYGGLHPEYATMLERLGLLWYLQNQFREARDCYAEALPIYREAFGCDEQRVGACLRLIGTLEGKKADYVSANRALTQALAIDLITLGRIHPSLAEDHYQLSWIALRAGNIDRALSHSRESVDIYVLLDQDASQSILVLAQALQQAGDFVGAEMQLRHSLTDVRNQFGARHVKVGVALTGIAELQYDRGDFVDGEAVSREAIEILEENLGRQHPYVALNYNNLANLVMRQDRYAEADTLFRIALSLRESIYGSAHPDVAQTHLGIGYLYKEIGRLDEAEEQVRTALNIYLELAGEMHPTVAQTQNNFARLLQERGRYAEAETLYVKALATRRALLGDENKYTAQSLQNLARLRQMQGDLESAGQLMEESVRCYEIARRRAGAGLARATFQKSTYNELAKNYLLLGEENLAWDAMERHLARALLDLLQATERRSLSSAEIAHEDSLRIELNEVSASLDAARKAAARGRSEEMNVRLSELQGDYLRLLSSWEACQDELRSQHPITEGQPASLREVQSGLESRTAVLGWLDAEEGDTTHTSWAYLIRRTGSVVWRELPPAGSHAKATGLEHLDIFRDALTTPSAFSSAITSSVKLVWKDRLSPLASELADVDHLVVIPTGRMLDTPVEALIDDDGIPVVDRFRVSYAPSATIHTWLNNQRGRKQIEPSDRVLLVGDPVFSPEPTLIAAVSSPADSAMHNTVVNENTLVSNRSSVQQLLSLPGTRLEVNDIARLFDSSTILLGTDADEERLMNLAESKELGRFSCIHIATHVLINSGRPAQSALVLSYVDYVSSVGTINGRIRTFDGLLTTKEILDEWVLDAELVVLSACETALGEELAGEGYVGFSHAFLQAGARSLIVSLWKVEDRASAMLMKRFYENLVGERGEELREKAQALREAKNWLRIYTDVSGETPYSHPYYWAAFVLIGS